MMKKWGILFMLSLLPLVLTAQEIRYDTIKVSPNDERNIHRGQRAFNASNEAVTTYERLPNKAVREANPVPLFDRKKMRFGANLGLSISRNYTNLGVGPQVGYQFNNYFMAGVGLKYYYNKARFRDYDVRNNLFGANVFGYFYPVRFITLFIQPEINYTRSTLTYTSGEEPYITKGFAPSVVAGAGLRLGFTHLTINYDVVQHRLSPHPSGFYMGVSAFF